MRTAGVPFTVLSLFLLLAFSPGFSQEAGQTVVVFDFLNRAGPDYNRLASPARDRLETLLFQTGLFRVLESERLKSILAYHLEQEKLKDVFTGYPPGNEGDQNKLVGIAQLAGADYAALGTISRVVHEARQYQGRYGRPVQNIRFTLTASMKLVHVPSGVVVFADQADAAKALRQSPGVVSLQDDAAAELLDAALVEMANRLVKAYPSMEKPAAAAVKTVTVQVSTDPAGASVLIDGVLAGTTPAQLSLTPGLKMVEISLQGYQPWRNAVEIRPGLILNPRLAELPRPSPSPGEEPYSKIIIEEHRREK